MYWTDDSLPKPWREKMWSLEKEESVRVCFYVRDEVKVGPTAEGWAEGEVGVLSFLSSCLHLQRLCLSSGSTSSRSAFTKWNGRSAPRGGRLPDHGSLQWRKGVTRRGDKSSNILETVSRPGTKERLCATEGWILLRYQAVPSNDSTDVSVHFSLSWKKKTFDWQLLEG